VVGNNLEQATGGDLMTTGCAGMLKWVSTRSYCKQRKWLCDRKLKGGSWSRGNRKGPGATAYAWLNS